MVQYKTIMLIGGQKLEGQTISPTPTSTFYPCPFVFTCWPKEKVQEAGVNRKRLLVTQLGMKRSRKLNRAWNFFSKSEVELPRNMGRKTKAGLCISSLKRSI